jgi:hypothetical protein
MKKTYRLNIDKFINRFLLPVLAISVFSYVVNFSGCNNLNDLITPEDQDVTVEAAFMRGTSEIISVCSNVNVYLVLIANGVTNIPGCPDISVNGSSGTFTVDFGAGCITDSIKRSGSYNVGYFINSTGDSMSASISFNNYKVYNTITSDVNYASITGTEIISTKNYIGSAYQSRFNISNTISTNTGNSKTVSLILTVPNANINNTLPVFGTFNITGSGTLYNVNTNSSYNYTADPSNQVVYSNACKHPTSGKIYLDNSGNRFSADYSPNSNCNGVISITKFGITKYVNLTTLDF